jgi:hypothetical protein
MNSINKNKECHVSLSTPVVFLALGTRITINIAIKTVKVNYTVRAKTLIQLKQEGIKILMPSHFGCTSY